jgi:alpha-tubulin suppressor-like RCC1 family protein
MTTSLARICTLCTLFLFALIISACSGGGGGGGGKVSDTTPDAFSFTAVTDVEPASQQTSNSISVAGIDNTTSVSVTGGTFSINNAAYGTSGTVKAGDTVTVRLAASSSFATQTQATLTIGGVSANFAATTRAADRTPNSFSFAAATNQNFTAQVESTGVTIMGIDVGTPVSVTGGEYAIGTGSFTSTAGTIGNNQSIKLRGTSAPTSSTATTVSVTIGSATQSFSITTTDQAAPKITALKLTDGADLKTATTLTAESTCSNCLQDQTQYAWYVEGVTNPVSTMNTYAIEANYRTSKITIVATPKSALGSGKLGSVSYKVNQVEEIVGNQYAFAAIKTDGSVTAWGLEEFGGNSSPVQSQLIEVKSIAATNKAFAAVRKDGKVVTWGLAAEGGDSSAVQASLVNVKSVTGNGFAFAAVKADGGVVTWGLTTLDGVPTGGDSSAVVASLVDVESISATNLAFAALRADGSVVTWGRQSTGGDSSAVANNLIGIHSIFSTGGAFVAIKPNAVISWGSVSSGADTSSISSELTGVKSIVGYRLGNAFAAIKSDDTVISWGNAAADSSSVASSLVNVKTLTANQFAFAALKTNGTVVTWGDERYGGNSSTVASQLTNVKSITATNQAFAALKTDGTVVTWGDAERGGSAITGGVSVASSLVGVKSIASGAGQGSFAAIKSDGSVIHWGVIAQTVPTFTLGNTLMVESNL